MLAPTSAASSAIPSARSSAHWTGRSAGAASPTVSEWAVPPIALTSERLAAAALRPMSPRLGPLAPEVPPLDQQVGRDHDVALRGADHGGVVTRPDEHVLALAEPSGQGPDQAELPGVGQGGVGGEGAVRRGRGGHGAITPDPRPRTTRAVVFRPGWSSGRLRALQTFPITEGVHMVVQAYILIQTDVGKAAEVANGSPTSRASSSPRTSPAPTTSSSAPRPATSTSSASWWSRRCRRSTASRAR